MKRQKISTVAQHTFDPHTFSGGRGKSFYGVRVGKETGVFNSWREVEPFVKGYSGAVFKKFQTWQEAAEFVEGTVKNLPNIPVQSSTSDIDDKGDRMLLVVGNVMSDTVVAGSTSRDKRLLSSSKPHHHHDAVPTHIIQKSISSVSNTIDNKCKTNILHEKSTLRIIVRTTYDRRGDNSTDARISGYNIVLMPAKTDKTSTMMIRLVIVEKIWHATSMLSQNDTTYTQQLPKNKRSALVLPDVLVSVELTSIQKAYEYILSQFARTTEKPEIGVRDDNQTRTLAETAIYTTNLHVYNCIVRYAPKWQKNEWKTSQGIPVKHAHILARILALQQTIEQYAPMTQLKYIPWNDWKIRPNGNSYNPPDWLVLAMNHPIGQ